MKLTIEFDIENTAEAFTRDEWPLMREMLYTTATRATLVKDGWEAIDLAVAEPEHDWNEGVEAA